MHISIDFNLETKLIERFFQKAKIERYKAFIKSNITREKFIQSLSHFNDLRKYLFEEVKGDEHQVIIDHIKILGNLKDCYIVSENSELDGKRLPIEEALSRIIGRGYGSLIIFGDADIVYYEGEGPNDRWISIL